MKSFKLLMCQLNISDAICEELHKELKDILNVPENDRSAVYKNGKLNQNKLNDFIKKTRSLIADNQDTGLDNGKPKEGSSRAVFFPHTDKQICVDGKDVSQPTAIKIAFPGNLDNYTGDTHLLGEHQNRIESDHFTIQNHSMLHQNEDGSYNTNHNGVLAPVLDSHKDHHWLEMAKADKMTAPQFTEMTKIKSHPKGLSFKKFTDMLKLEHDDAHGIASIDNFTDAEKVHIRSHPLFENTLDFIQNTNNNAHDLRRENYGTWTHPITGKKHPVILDYGFGNDVSKLYTTARRRNQNNLYNNS